MNYLDNLETIASTDVSSLKQKDKEYGSSWKQRGGVGAFMMLARKWDRLEKQVAGDDCDEPAGQYDIFQHIQFDDRAEGLIDDIRDLRRYLLLVEAEMIDRGVVDDVPGHLMEAISEDINKAEEPVVDNLIQLWTNETSMDYLYTVFQHGDPVWNTDDIDTARAKANDMARAEGLKASVQIWENATAKVIWGRTDGEATPAYVDQD